MDFDHQYDVVIVGGRPAGASLAARLAARGLAVAIFDKAVFPSQPEVPSCPIMYSSAMALLDEIGFHEDAYRAAATRIEAGIVGFEGYFHAVLPIPSTRGRNYIYGFDRARFDHALWTHLARFPTLTRCAGFAMRDLLRGSDGRVVGIEGGFRDGPRERIGARLAVVGADGRHSLVARRAGARVLEDQAAYTSTVHFAEWDGLAPALPDGAAALQIVATGRGRSVLFFPSCDGRVAVATHVRSDRAQVGGDVQQYYEGHLRALPTVCRRLAGAQRVGPILGIRRVANRYREPGGPGWVLVGDALHHKDPVDGQGIYDALIEARCLADLLVARHEQRMAWDALVDGYRAAVWSATHQMFDQTMRRLERELYREPPAFLIRTLLRWSLTDPEYQRRFLLFLTRTLPPEEFRTRSLMVGVVARGLARDLAHRMRRPRD